MSIPTFKGPDGIYREKFIFSTTKEANFFTGKISANVADLQVSILEAAFTSDPDLIIWDSDTFTIPNPSAYPEGIYLQPGSNLIQVRAITTVGTISSPGMIQASLIPQKDSGVITVPPSAIAVEKKDGTVKIKFDGLTDSAILGYHCYASTESGGGAGGYFRVNADLISGGTTENVVSELGTLSTSANVVVDTDGSLKETPQYLHYKSTQEDKNSVILQTDMSELVSIPEGTTKIQTDITVSSVSTKQKLSFIHDRNGDFSSTPSTLPNGDFAALPTEDPLFYVVTSVYYDSTSGLEVESHFSPEVSGYPLRISATIGGIPTVGRAQIIQDTTLAIHRSQTQLAVHAGSYTKDVTLDPFSSEVERLRFILDFMHQAQSFSTLLNIDDPSESGDPIPVSQSAYKLALKQAFFLTENQEVQDLIDMSFDHLATKVGTTRKAGVRSRGEVTFYLTNTPNVSFPIPIGTGISSGDVQFRTTQHAEISVSNLASFYSPSTGRYSVKALVEAEDSGTSGNLASGQISQLTNTIAGLFVINEARTFGGKDAETNRELAEVAQRKLASLDVGTTQGYTATVSALPGVEQIQVVDSSHVLMQRDFDEATSTHRGGKVDVWVKGEILSPTTETFAFSFEIKKNIQFVVSGSPSNLEFVAVDSDLSAANPIIQMLDISSWGYVFENASTGEIFNLTDVQITDYNKIKLSNTYNSAQNIQVTNVFLGDYRYRSSDKFYFTQQPIRSISSFAGSVTGEVDPDVYSTYQLENPLRNGRSKLGKNFLQLIDSQDSTEVIPSGTPISVTEESHVILQTYTEFLNNLGINPLTIKVYDSTRTTLYISPHSLTGTPDYSIVDGSTNIPIGIKRTSASTIPDGATLSIDYDHDENFTVSYSHNLLTKLAQEEVDKTRHITADVLIKDSIPVPLDLTMTVVLDRSSGENQIQPGVVDSEIRTNILNHINALGLGRPLRQADIISLVDSTENVSYPVTPLTKMTRSSGSLVLKEELTLSLDSDYEILKDWSTTTISAYLLKSKLKYATSTGGGPSTQYRGVDVDDLDTLLITSSLSSSGSPLNQKELSSYIIGDSGMSIPGYTDDATLLSQAPYSNSDQNNQWVLDQRKELTQNRVVLALKGGVDSTTALLKKLTDQTVTNLSHLQIFEDTIVVKSKDLVTTYSKDVDYVIVPGTTQTPAGIKRTAASTIVSGTEVSIDYKYRSGSVIDLPTKYKVTCTYIVASDTQARNISTGPTEYLTLGELVLSFDEDVES